MRQRPRTYSDPRIAQFEPLVRNRARQFFRGYTRSHRELEDLQSTAREAVWRATESYRDDGGAKFSTYVQTVVFRALNNERKTLKRPRRNGVLLSISPRDDHDEPVILASADEPADTIRDAADRRQAVRDSVDRLEPRLKKIIELRFWRDQTLDEIGVSLGLTRERIRQLEAKAFELLRPKLQHLWIGLEAA